MSVKKKISKIWGNRRVILEGLKNSILIREEIEKIASERKAICDVCPHNDPIGTTCIAPGTQPCCKLCGCCLHFKQRALSASCDDKRWGAILSQEDEDILNEKLNTPDDKV